MSEQRECDTCGLHTLTDLSGHEATCGECRGALRQFEAEGDLRSRVRAGEEPCPICGEIETRLANTNRQLDLVTCERDRLHATVERQVKEIAELRAERDACAEARAGLRRAINGEHGYVSLRVDVEQLDKERRAKAAGRRG